MFYSRRYFIFKIMCMVEEYSGFKCFCLIDIFYMYICVFVCLFVCRNVRVRLEFWDMEL